MNSTDLNNLLLSEFTKKLESDNVFLHIEIEKHLFESQGLIEKNDVRKPKIPKGKKLTFFLDIDSTITDEDSDLPDPRCKPIFTQMQKKHKHKIYFITGRPEDKVRSVIKYCSAQRSAIVENGGLIISARKTSEPLGDRKMCLGAWKKIRNDVPSARLAPRKVQNTTEVILEKNGTLGDIRSSIKKHRLPVEIDASKRFYHLHKKGVHKGYGMTDFIHKNRIDYRYTVAIGDSEIDLPMIKKARFAFLVKNAPKSMQKRVNSEQVLRHESFDGVIEAFMRLEPKIKKFVQDNGFLK